MEDPNNDLERFAKYGVAWRADNSLTLNTFGLQLGMKKNGFVGVIARLEETHEKLLMPRVVLHPNSHRHSSEIISEWSAKLEEEKKGRDTKRIPGLTHYGNAITDYFTIKWACEAMMELVLEQRTLPPPHVVTIFGRSLSFGRDTPWLRRSIGEGCAEFLAERAAGCQIIVDELRKVPGTPRSIFNKRFGDLPYVPMAKEELDAFRDALYMDEMAGRLKNEGPGCVQGSLVTVQAPGRPGQITFPDVCKSPAGACGNPADEVPHAPIARHK